MEACFDDGVDRLERGRARDRHVAEELAGARVGDDGSLVADDGVVQSRLDEVWVHAAEHPSGDDDHVNTRRADAGDRRARAGPEDGVLGDERPVEVDREGGDVLREGLRELDYGGVPPVALTT